VGLLEIKRCMEDLRGNSSGGSQVKRLGWRLGLFIIRGIVDLQIGIAELVRVAKVVEM